MVDPLNPDYKTASFLEPTYSPSKYIPRESKEIVTDRIEIKPRDTMKLDDIPGATKSPRKTWHDYNHPDTK